MQCISRMKSSAVHCMHIAHGSWAFCGGMNVSPYAGSRVAGWLAKRLASLQLFSAGGGAVPDLWSGIMDSRR